MAPPAPRPQFVFSGNIRKYLTVPSVPIKHTGPASLVRTDSLGDTTVI